MLCISVIAAIARRQVERREDDTVRLTLTYCNTHKHHKDFLVRFAEMPEVRSIEPGGS